MKKIFVLIFALMALNSFSQQSAVIKKFPQHTAGYLVLNNNFNSPVEYYSIDLIKYTYDHFNVVNQESIAKIKLVGTNYTSIPEKFTNLENISA